MLRKHEANAKTFDDKSVLEANHFPRNARKRERSDGLTWRVVRQSRGQRRHGGGLPAAGGGGGGHRKGCWLTSDFRNEHLWRPAGDAAGVGAAEQRRRCAGDEETAESLSVSFCHFCSGGWPSAISPPPALLRRYARKRLQHK